MKYHVYIGYDEREKDAFEVCKHSLLKHSSVPLEIHKLDHKSLRNRKLLTRTWTIDKDGQYVCNVDKRPFSTQFSHTRFLVPELWRLEESEREDLCVFVDCDFLFVDDIANLFFSIRSNPNWKSNAVYCVFHEFFSVNAKKMDGVEQHNYSKKLWSSLMVFNMNHFDNLKLTPSVVNIEDGRNLHQFMWTSAVGSINPCWNYIPDSTKTNTGISAIHYTELNPWIDPTVNFGDLWVQEYKELLKEKLTTNGYS